jgi:benzoate/toluate 1,2-dioxygenase beta subunit
MPSWDDDDQLTEDPQSEISLIYYPNRNGLEDRVFRIKTERSSASMPEPRTNHMISNVEILADRGDSLDVRYNFHTLSHRYKVTDHFFGSIYLTLKVMSEGSYQITRKKIVLKNDYISQVIDIYHI